MNRRGFTLVEIVMVIILLGVLGIIGTIGLNSAVSSDRGMYERQLQSAIRYAQNYAMSHFTYTAVVFSSSGSSPSCALPSSGTAYSGYAVCACNGNSPSSSLQPLVNPLAQTADNFYVTMNYGISYSVSVPQGFAANYIAFNSQGEPGTFQNNGNPCPSIGGAVFKPYGNNTNTPISLSFGASPPQLTFYIYPVTGLVSYNGSL
ncbi:MAG: type II secretion system protein [Deltaproteobacteria bacterium]|nr:type II secretion system protein [Deltaproteobacteria bacterium]